MRTALILTDFSEAAFRAAEYVCSVAEPLQIGRIVLYHAYQMIITPTDIPTAPVKTAEELYLESMKELALTNDRLKPRCPGDVAIEMFAENTFSPDTVNERCMEQKADLIVMGASGKSGLDRIMAGSITARMLSGSQFPLLMVPEEAVIGREIKTIVFATDLKDIPSIPVAQLYSFLDAFKAEVHVVNAGPAAEGEYVSGNRKEAVADLHKLLDKYPTSFYYIDGDNVVDSILTFAGEHHASLIISIPKKHGFLSAVFHKSVSKRLAYNSMIPLLCLPETR